MANSKASRLRWSAGAALATALVVLGVVEWKTQAGVPAASAEAAAKDTSPAIGSPKRVAALARLAPKDGVIHVAGPSGIVSKLLVDKGSTVKVGDVIAVLDTLAVHLANADRLRAELANAETDYERERKLYRSGGAAESQIASLRTKVEMLRADLARAEAELELDQVRAPVDGQVIDVHARPGERVGADGIVELARTDSMYAIAEIYETDIGRVRAGQRATVASPALAEDLHGTVERIGLKIARKNILESDPAAQADVRVVEVEIRLDDSAKAASLTNLRVQVTIEAIAP